MAVDRTAIVKRADEFIEQGKLDLAIAEYRGLVEEQPGDVSAANTLGDLYARHGEIEKAVEQFTRLAESERAHGFASKAVALYKKALKVDPGCERALSQLADIAVGQDLLADATLYWNRLLQQQRGRSDDPGVADTLIRLAGLPVAKAETRLLAARAADKHRPHESARLFADAARALDREARAAEAVDTWLEAAQRSEDLEILRAAARACIAAGSPERAAGFVTRDVAGDDQALRALLGDTTAADDSVPEPHQEPAPEEEPVRTLEVKAAASEDQWVEVSAESDEFGETDVLAELEEDEPVAPAAVPAIQPEPAEPAWAGPPAPAFAVRPTPAVADADTFADWDTDEPALDEEALISQLEVAAGTPALQFQAAAQLGRLFIQRGQIDRGVEWLQRACLAQAPVRDHGLAAQYDLADALERAGRHDQALAVWSDLEFDAGEYRDVSERLARLTSRRGPAR